MANKKYYWLKLKKDFFQSKHIRKLLNMKNGYKMVVLYQILMLEFLDKAGKITVEYEANIKDELMLIFNESDKKFASELIDFLLGHKLIKHIKTNIYKLVELSECVGRETNKALLMRNNRKKIKSQNKNTLEKKSPT